MHNPCKERHFWNLREEGKNGPFQFHTSVWYWYLQMCFCPGAKLSLEAPEKRKRCFSPYPEIHKGAWGLLFKAPSSPPQDSFTASSLLQALCQKGWGCQANISSKAFLHFQKLSLQTVGSCFLWGLLGRGRAAPISDPSEFGLVCHPGNPNPSLDHIRHWQAKLSICLPGLGDSEGRKEEQKPPPTQPAPASTLRSGKAGVGGN